MASGDTLLIMTAMHAVGPNASFATMDERNGHCVLDFDASANESAVFAGVMPRQYGGGGVTVYLHYAMSSATSGTVDWDVAFERIGEGAQDVDSDGYAAAQSADDSTVPGTCGYVAVASVAFSDGAEMDNLAAGEGFSLKVTRDATNDDAAGDAELFFVELRETPGA